MRNTSSVLFFAVLEGHRVCVSCVVSGVLPAPPLGSNGYVCRSPLCISLRVFESTFLSFVRLFLGGLASEFLSGRLVVSWGVPVGGPPGGPPQKTLPEPPQKMLKFRLWSVSLAIFSPLVRIGVGGPAKNFCPDPPRKNRAQVVIPAKVFTRTPKSFLGVRAKVFGWTHLGGSGGLSRKFLGGGQGGTPWYPPSRCPQICGPFVSRAEAMVRLSWFEMVWLLGFRCCGRNFVWVANS